MFTILEKIKIKIIVFIFLFIYLSSSNAMSEIYEKIKVNGNDRISKETIIMFSGLKIEENIDMEQLNESIKNLYETDYFKNVEINVSKNVIHIFVDENPIHLQLMLQLLDQMPLQLKHQA